MLLFDADPRVADREFPEPIDVASRNHDLAVRLVQVVDRIADEVLKQLRQMGSVVAYLGKRALDTHFIAFRWCQRVDDLLGRCVAVDVLERRVHTTNTGITDQQTAAKKRCEA